MVKTFYVTTAIDYVNASPHIGHAYQKIIADVLSRWHKILGDDVFYLTGTDEHGLKIARSAEEKNLAPKKFVDKLSREFKKSWELLDIEYDRFIRTTDEDHEKIVKEFIKKLQKKDEIYKGTYEGLYCVGCEAYLTEKDLVNGECQFHPGRKIETLKEDTYFFKLSKYQDKLLKLYKENPEYILPKKRAKEIVNRVKEGLKDLSITRTSFKWGIPYPGDKEHVTYVWFEALLNYITGIGWPKAKFKKYWPANVELLGADNSWFHCVIWPAMLLAGDVKPAKTIFVHGFLTFNGQKISKSLGNVISPEFLVGKYGADSIRYYVCKDFILGDDGDFSEKRLKEVLNGELANDLGNLVSRTLTLCEKYFKGELSKKKDDNLFKKLNLEKIKSFVDAYELHHALDEIWKFVRSANKYINDKEPWKNEKDRDVVLYNLLESLRVISILISPFIPGASEKINKQLGVKVGIIKDIKFGLVKKYKIKKGEILFKKLE